MATRLLLLLGACAAAAVSATLLLVSGDATPTSAAGPGMTLSAPAQVPVGNTFVLELLGEPEPGGDAGAFQAEVVFPAGLTWAPRSTCQAELKATTGGNPPLICLRATGPNGEARHVVNSGFIPPLPPFDTPLGTLVELDIECTSAGTHTIVLTASPDSSYGAVYFDTALFPIPLKTTPYDVDGDTTTEGLADTIQVECDAGLPSYTPTYTPTFTPTRTPTNTPTPTPTFTPTKNPAGDTDGDGCLDLAENGPDPALGGHRNYMWFWDFFDVPAGAGLARDGDVTGQDIFAVLGRFNAEGTPGDPLSPPPPPPAYHAAYDRGPLVGPEPWDLGAPDGAITGSEIFAVIAQFGHSCSS